MSQRLAPLRTVPNEIIAEHGGRRIRRILGRPTVHEHVGALVDLDTSSGDPFTATWLDATSATPVLLSSGTTAVHVLWTDTTTPRSLGAGHDADEPSGLRSFDVTPGDTITIPPATPFRIGEGILAFLLGTAAVGPEETPVVPPGPMPLAPVHGLNLFHRFNRQTICSATAALVLERWKLTHPLQMALETDRWHYLANLTTPVALTWSGGSELLERVRSRLLPPGLESITLVPDGLGYVLIGFIPNLERDIITPLRSAGYDPASIASLGVPIDRLR